MHQRFLIASVGSLGDALPYLQLAVQLQSMGHTVRLFCNEAHRQRIEQAGVTFISAGAGLEYEKTTLNPDLWHPVKGMGVLWRGLLAPCIAPLYRAIRDAQEAQRDGSSWHVVAGPQMLGARLAQEHLSTRLTSVYTAPSMLRTTLAPTTVAHTAWPRHTPRWLLAALWAAVDRYKLEPMARSSLNRVCAELGIAPPPAGISLFGRWVHSVERGITLYPAWFSPVPADQPARIVSGDFPCSIPLPNQTELPEPLSAFLQAGAPPLVVMLGSAMAHAEPVYARWQEAAIASGQRAVLVSAHAAQLPRAQHADVLHMAFAPFGALLPRSCALVHHGGIGSCSQALASGIPQIIQPHSHDQFENLRCAQALGVAQRLGRDASVAQMQAALRSALTPKMKQTARAVQANMSAQSLARVAQLLVD